MRRLSISKLELILVCAVVLVAAWLRFSSLDQVQFQWDQAEISKWALNMAQQGEITWIGPISSTRLDTFPVAIWLLAIPYAISPSPVFATGFVATLNLVTVVGCYFVVRYWFGWKAALVATLLFAVAPWAVIYSRRIWHTVLLPPFVMLHAVTGWLAFVRGRRWALLVHSLSLAMLVQIHLSALAFVPLTILWALVFCKRLDWRVVPISVLLAALTFVPYFAIDAQKDWRNVRLFAEIMHQPSKTSADAVYATWTVTTGLGLQWLTGPDRYPDFLAGAPNARWLFGVEGGLALVGAVVALGYAIRQARTSLSDEAAALLMTVTWLAMPALFLTNNKTGAAPHYLGTTFPTQFVLIGWLVSLMWRRSGRLARVGQISLIVLVGGIAAAQTYEIISIRQFVMSHNTQWGYGTPIAYEIHAVQTAAHLGQEIGAAETILLSKGDEPRMFEMPVVADVLMYQSPHRSVDIRTALVFPAAPAVYWATYDMTPGEEWFASFTPEVNETRIPLREEVRSFRFYRWSGGEPTIPGMRPLSGEPRTWTNGAQLVGYQLVGDLRPGGAFRWTLVWRATKTPTEDVYYHWFNHLLDGQGQMIGQKDGPSFLPAYWRAGDIILNWFDFQIPSEALSSDYTMRVGMYAYPVIENIRLLGSGDTSGKEWIEIGPLRAGEWGDE